MLLRSTGFYRIFKNIYLALRQFLFQVYVHGHAR